MVTRETDLSGAGSPSSLTARCAGQRTAASRSPKPPGAVGLTTQDTGRAERRGPGVRRAFGLDQGESLGGLLSQGPVTPALAHLVTDKQGFGWLSEDDFVSHFAADVDPVKAKVMYAVQQALAMSAFGDMMGVPAWKTLPSWSTLS